MNTHLTEAQLEQLGTELDAIRNRVRADLGERDVQYIRRMIKTQRGLEITGRLLLELAWLPPAWLAGTAALSVSKILDNMEIGHNVMHGQYDWTGDPALDSKNFEWDTMCPADQWRHSHNYLHHTHTNVLGMDKDIGYGILRMSEEQPWKPYYLGNPLYALLLMLLFEEGVALHDLGADWANDNVLKPGVVNLQKLRAVGRKVGGQVLKDYVLFPLLAGPGAPFTFTGNLTANVVRNIWTFTIIFCGHFPAGVEEFSQDEVENETRGGWYVRQMLGSANITGSKLFHIMSGNLSHQIEHHLFPDLPAHRYAEIAVEVRQVCERYGLPYNSGPLRRQFGSVVQKICRLALPSVGVRAGAEPVAAPVPVTPERELVAA